MLRCGGDGCGRSSSGVVADAVDVVLGSAGSGHRLQTTDNLMNMKTLEL